MHILLHNLIGFSIKAKDGEIGRVHDLYFDDASWTIRYLVVKTGNWFSGRMVLIPSTELGQPDWDNHLFNVELTCDQVLESPDIDTERPVYRQQEIVLHDYYQWLPYWKVGMGNSFTPVQAAEEPEVASKQECEAPENENEDNIHGDPHLRSLRHIRGYYIHANDGNIGHVEDYIVGNRCWKLTHFVADTRNFFPGKKVVLPVSVVKSVEWLDYSVHIDLTRDEVRSAKEFNPAEIKAQEVSSGKYWIAMPSKTRHVEGCPYFHKTKEGYFTDEEEGVPCSKCGG